MALSRQYRKPKFIFIIQYLSGGVISSQVIVTVIATLGAIVSGTILGWSSPVRSMFRADHEFPFPVTGKHVQTFNSVFGVGAMLGALPAGYVSSMIGCQTSMMLSEGFVLVGWAILVLPTSVWMLSAARVVQGVGVGAMCAVIPAYVGEIADPQMRGRLETIFQFFVVTGILYSYTLGSFMMYELFCTMCAIWVVLHILAILCIPESPYYLMSNNDSDGAAASLEVLRDYSDTTKELAAIKSFVEEQKLQSYTIYQVLSNKANRKSLYISIGCMFFQQMSGINVLIFYMTDIFNSAGSHLSPHTCSITVSGVQLAITFVALLVVDECGRKLLLVISGLLMAVSHAGLGVFYLIKTHYPELSIRIHWLPLICITLYISAFSIGYGPLPWVLMGEIHSPEVKPIGTSLTSCTNWSLVFVVTYAFNELILLWGQAGCFFTFSAFCFMGTLFAAIVVPETKNKTLAEIQLKLSGKQVNPIAMTTTMTTAAEVETYETTVFS